MATPPKTMKLYDPISDSWTTGPALPAGRPAHESVIAEDEDIFVIGGLREDQNGHFDQLLSSTMSCVSL